MTAFSPSASSGHTIDLSLEDGEDRVCTAALHEAWASPEAIGFTQRRRRQAGCR
jgi:hypothetical protein